MSTEIAAREIAQTSLLLLRELGISKDAVSSLVIELSDGVTLIMHKNQQNMFEVSFKKWHPENGHEPFDKKYEISLEKARKMFNIGAQHIQKISIQTGYVDEKKDQTQNQPAVLFWV